MLVVLLDQAGVLLVALFRCFLKNMSLDGIKSDQDSGAQKPKFITYQPTHVSGLAFYQYEKLIQSILQGLSHGRS